MRVTCLCLRELVFTFSLRFVLYLAQADEAMADKTFVAKVHWWDSWTVHVQCPFCTKIHRHGFGESYDSVHRVAYCDSSPQLSHPSYQFKYQFSQVLETTAYEIDKANKRYVALDAGSPQPGPDLLEEGFANLALNQKPAVALERWKDAVETITIDRTDTILRRCKKRLVAMKHSP